MINILVFIHFSISLAENTLLSSVCNPATRSIVSPLMAVAATPVKAVTRIVDASKFTGKLHDDRYRLRQ